jgi:uncharacterized membrane protein
MIKHILPVYMSTFKLFQQIIVVVVIAFAMGLTGGAQLNFPILIAITKKAVLIDSFFYFHPPPVNRLLRIN